MANKGLSNFKQFEREIKRLEKLIIKLESQGFIFIKSPIPKQPSSVSKDKLERIKSITEETLISKAYTIDTETGEVTKAKPIKPHKPSTPSTGISHPSSIEIPIEQKSKTKSEKQTTPLTDEERKRRRREAAKKAAQTRKRQEAENPELKLKRDLTRRANLQKARETKKLKRGEKLDYNTPQIDFYDSPEEIEKEEIEKAKNKQQPPEPFTPEEPENDKEPYEPPDFYPDADEIRMENLMSILQGASNANTADLLMSFLMDAIAMEEDDESFGLKERLRNAGNTVIVLAQQVAYDSDPEELISDAYAVAYIILGDHLTTSDADDIERAAYEDRPPKRRRKTTTSTSRNRRK